MGETSARARPFPLARQGRLEDAARLIDHVDASQTVQSMVRAPSLQLSFDEALAIVELTLGEVDGQRLRAEGRLLAEDQAVALAFSANSQACRA